MSVLLYCLISNSISAALRDAREGAMKDKKKYQGEVERIKVGWFNLIV